MLRGTGKLVPLFFRGKRWSLELAQEAGVTESVLSPY